MENKVIKIEGRLNYTMFPKFPEVLGGGEEGGFGIASWCVTDVLQGDPKVGFEDCITVKGHYSHEINTAKTYTILAKEVTHEKYGVQYDLMFIGEILDLSNVINQKSFLKTFLTELQIKEMFKTLDNPLQTIAEHDVEELKRVHGIGDYIAGKIIDRYEENKDYCDVYIQLDDLGLTPAFIQKLIKRYKNPNRIIDVVKNNPYQLSYDVEGIGFRTADNIALKNGISPTSKERIKSYINYLLEELGQEGNSYIYAIDLNDYIFKELGSEEEILEMYYNEEGEVVGNNIAAAISEMTEEGKLVLESNDETLGRPMRRVYLTKYYNLEKKVASHLKRLNSGVNNFEFDNWKVAVREQEREQGWEFTEEQMEGIQACLENQVVFITGGSGTGKSSTLSGVLQALGCYQRKYLFAQTSLSGKAASRMQEITEQEGQTIHRLLGISQETNGFYYDKDNLLPHDIIILDELSLVGGEIFLSLIEAIRTGSKLIMLGDMGQLEAIGCMNLAKDIYDSDNMKVVELTKIHRQAKKSGIILASQSVRQGERIFNNQYTGEMVIGELQDMYFSVHSDQDGIREDVMKYFKSYWESGKVKDIMDIQIIAPVKERGEACVFNLNNDVQKYINPYNKNKKQLKVIVGKDKCFYLREGDKVMNTQNDYKTTNQDGTETPIFNGWTGIVVKISDMLNSVSVYFPIVDGTITLSYETAKSNLILGYASTVHKQQGSESDVVIGALDYSTPPQMRTKELVYTLITRAKKECVFVVQNKAFNNAIQRSGVTNKNTFLKELLDSNKQIVKK